MSKKWYTEHNRLAHERLKEIKKSLEQQNISSSLPKFSTNLMEWIAQARPTVEGIRRNFLTIPFWTEIYKDNHSSMMITGGRQIYKSTYLTDLIAYTATTTPNAQIGYVSFKQENTTTFSRQKLLVGTFLQNPQLAQFLRKG